MPPANGISKERLPRLPGLPRQGIIAAFEAEINSKRPMSFKKATNGKIKGTRDVEETTQGATTVDLPADVKTTMSTTSSSSFNPGIAKYMMASKEAQDKKLDEYLVTGSPGIMENKTSRIAAMQKASESSMDASGRPDPTMFGQAFLNNGKKYGTPGQGLHGKPRIGGKAFGQAQSRFTAKKLAPHKDFSNGNGSGPRPGHSSRKFAGSSMGAIRYSNVVGSGLQSRQGPSNLTSNIHDSQNYTTYEEHEACQKEKKRLEAVQVAKELENSLLARSDTSQEDLVQFSSRENSPTKSPTQVSAPQIEHTNEEVGPECANNTAQGPTSSSNSNIPVPTRPERDSLSRWFGARPWDEVEDIPRPGKPSARIRTFSESSDLIDLGP